jgi:hypothetical protein
MTQHDDLPNDLRLSRFAGYIRREQGLYGAAWGLCGGLAAALAVNVAAWLFPILTFATRLIFSIGLAALFALLAFLFAYLYPRSAATIARLSDARMGLRARLATAVEIEGGQLPVPGDIAARQRADAQRAAERANPKEAFAPRRAGFRRQALAAAVLAALLVVGVVVPNPQEARIAQRQAEQETIERQAERLEEVRQAIAENDQLSEEDREILLQELDDAIQDLRSGELSREQALARLSEMEGKLQELLDQDVDAQRRALDEAGRQAAQSEDSQEIGQALSAEAYSAAAEAMSGELAERLPQMSAQELAAVAERLEAMSGALSEANPALAQALRDAAQALHEGDVEAAQEALRRAGELTEAAGQQIAAQEATEGALGQIQEGRREIAQAGPQGEGADQGQGQGQGQQGQGQQGQQGQGQGQGQQGQGQPGQGQGQEGSGTGSGSGSGDSTGAGKGQPQDPGGPIAPNEPGEAGETPYDPIYDPERLGDGEGARVDVPGEGQGGPATGEGESGPHESGEALVPYNEVYTDYQAQASSALENSYIPRGLKDYVRAYFGALDPER